MQMPRWFRILPSSRLAIARFAVLVMLLGWTVTRVRLDRVAGVVWMEKREGDVLFQSLPHGPLVDAIEGVTQSEWSHCGVLMRRDGDWQVVEALGEVRWTPYVQWVVRGRGSRVQIHRPEAPTPEDVEKLRRELVAMTGRPYDFRYAPGDDEIYCSELVFLAFERAMGLRLAEWERLGDLNWRPHEAFIREMEVGPTQLERRMITPVALTRSPLLKQVMPWNASPTPGKAPATIGPEHAGAAGRAGVPAGRD